MLSFGPNPKNKLYTNIGSYSEYIKYVLFGRLIKDKGRAKIEIFEKALCDRFSTQNAVCVYQCRLGIYLAIKALIRPGQEVILSPYTITDVINMVIFAGGRPVFADVEHQTANISVSEIERLIGPNTGAVLITHLHGHAAEAHLIKKICDRFNIPMVEDAAQSFGVKEHGIPVGTIGDVGVFSFEMHKNVPTWLGGAVVSDRRDVVEKMRAELDTFSYPSLPGISQKVKKGLAHDLATIPVLFQMLTYPLIKFSYLKDIEFINSKVRRKPQVSEPAKELPEIYKSQFTSLQAELGLVQIKNVDRDIQKRIEYAHLYYEGLKNINNLVLPPLSTDASHTYLWFPVLSERREELLKFMFEKGRDIAAGHFLNSADSPRFSEFYRSCPNASKVERELLYLPTYPSYSSREVQRNIQVIREFYNLQQSDAQRKDAVEVLRS